jgi:hypothetical protein
MPLSTPALCTWTERTFVILLSIRSFRSTRCHFHGSSPHIFVRITSSSSRNEKIGFWGSRRKRGCRTVGNKSDESCFPIHSYLLLINSVKQNREKGKGNCTKNDNYGSNNCRRNNSIIIKGGENVMIESDATKRHFSLWLQGGTRSAPRLRRVDP